MFRQRKLVAALTSCPHSACLPPHTRRVVQIKLRRRDRLIALPPDRGKGNANAFVTTHITKQHAPPWGQTNIGSAGNKSVLSNSFLSLSSTYIHIDSLFTPAPQP